MRVDAEASALTIPSVASKCPAWTTSTHEIRVVTCCGDLPPPALYGSEAARRLGS